MNKTKIEWAEYTWNPITGCSPISEGCQNCYAIAMHKRFRGNNFKVTLHPERLGEPLKLRRASKIFVCSMSDLFHEDVPLEFIAEIFNIMASATLKCNHKRFCDHNEECWTGEPHTYILLTKRIERAKKILTGELENYLDNYVSGDWPINIMRAAKGWPLPNVWLGITAENQQAADQRIPLLLQTPAAKRFVSLEPLLGVINLMNIKENEYIRYNLLEGCGDNKKSLCQLT